MWQNFNGNPLEIQGLQKFRKELEELFRVVVSSVMLITIDGDVSWTLRSARRLERNHETSERFISIQSYSYNFKRRHVCVHVL